MIDVIIITYNEALNLPRCLDSLKGWTNKVFVIDSGSTDGTRELAQARGAEVVCHPWEGYAEQRNWGLRNLPLESSWILIIDADEVVSSDLAARLSAIAQKPVEDVKENGFFINRLTYFLDRPIRHCGYFPSWNMRFFKRGQGLYENRAVHEHVLVNPPTARIRELLLHDDRRGPEHYIAKHNRYSTLEARALVTELIRKETDNNHRLSTTTRRRRWLKRIGMRHIPLPGTWRFFYMYVLRLGFLDGYAGLEYCRLISMYDSMVAMKFRELNRLVRKGQQIREDILQAPSALAVPEGSEPLLHGSDGISRDFATQPRANRPPIIAPKANNAEPMEQLQPESSPWSLGEKIARALWMTIGRPLFRMSFHNWYSYRAMLLRIFGARIGTRVAIRPSVHIEIPWHLDIQNETTIGDHAILYSLGKIVIGERTIISQYSHLCAGTHDYTDRTFRLIRNPIHIGSDVWIGADVFVGPDVTIGSLAVIGARSSVYKDIPAKMVCVGNPAHPIKERNLH